MSFGAFRGSLIAAGLLALAAGSALAEGPAQPAAAGATPEAAPLAWAVRMAQSEMTRRGPEARDVRWDYTSGLLAWALAEVGRATRDDALRRYGEGIVDRWIEADGTIRGYRADEFNLDLIPPGRVVLELWEQTKAEKYRTAAAALRRQLAAQPRTGDGGFWHKQRYPYQMWLDGLYMASPFLADYGRVMAEPAAFDEAAGQLELMDRHGFDPATGLYRHAWDEKRAQPWSDPATGQSPQCWGRAVGWYAMALVDVLDDLPPERVEAVDSIQRILGRLAEGVVRWQDPATGVWFQVLDQGAREGNYREATASCMFVYALAKAVNRGYLPRAGFAPAAERGFAGVLREFVRRNADGTLSLTHCCQVAGLGYTNAAGRPRDGTFAYYVSEPVVDDDPKGVGPFLLAALELDRLRAPAPASADAHGWAQAEAILARIRAPEFPDRDSAITAFGAAPGGGDCTAAIAQAIEACHAAGGGRVLVPPGVWRTGAIRLRSGVNLHLADGATLRFDPDPARYPLVLTRWEGVECMNYSPLIYALDQENVAVTGRGTLDGGASPATWWAWNCKTGSEPPKQKAARERLLAAAEQGVPVERRVFGDGGFLRPNFLQFYRCRNVLVEGLTLVNSPMWEVHPVLSTNVIVRGLTIVSRGPNNDGCDPESCRDVLIEDCSFATGDDCIAIKSGRNADGRRLHTPAENIVVRRCTMRDGHGGVVIGSEISGGCRNVFVEDCTMDSPNLDRALRLKTNAARGGTIEHVRLRRVKIGRVVEAVLTIDLLYEEGARGDFPPTVRDVALEEVTATASPRVMFVRGFPGATIDGLRFADCVFAGVSQPEVLEGATAVVLRNVRITPAQPPQTRNSPAAP